MTATILRPLHLAPRPLALAVACALAAFQSHAQSTKAPAPTEIDRLSTRQQALPPAQGPSALWFTDSSLRLSQHLLRQSILEELSAQPQAQKLEALRTFLGNLPLTGRSAVPQPDVADLLATPVNDYALTDQTNLSRQSIPSRVVVLNGNGQICHVVLPRSERVETVLQRCTFSEQADEAWLIQADGASFRIGISPWNRQADVLVAPGAWVWLPPRHLQDSKLLSAQIARFLATQELPTQDVGTLTGMSDKGGMAAPALPRLGWTPMVSSNDWGESGLLQTPTARTGHLGEFRFSASRAYPYTRMNVFMQPTGWLEFGFRYTDIATALYGANIASEQTYKDKSLDFKAVLSEEGPRWPQVALGMRDIGGTGLFSSEYVVASKRHDSLDWSLGIGWGNMASSATLPNPLAGMFPALKTRRAADVGQGGVISGAGMFAGDAAWFGGVQWTLPDGKSALKLELDGNNYTAEPFGQNHGATTPWNVGWVYRVSPGFDLGLAFERGNRLAVSLTYGGNLRELTVPKPLDPPAPTNAQLIKARTSTNGPMVHRENVDHADLITRLRLAIQAQTGWRLLALEQHGGQWQLHLETDDAVYANERLQRLYAVLATTLPQEGPVVEVTLSNFGLPLRTVRFDRAAWLAQRVYPDVPALQLSAQEWQRPHAVYAPLKNSLPVSRWETGWGTTFSHILGGPNNFLLYQAGLRAYTQYRFDEHTWAFAQANLRLLDNYNSFVYDAPTSLPRVRTDQRRYVTTSRTTIPFAQLTRAIDLGHGHYASAYGGLLEPMYAGVGAEWLWRPWQGNWAFGVDVNQVQQREFEQGLGLRDYRTITGHATMYWNTGFDGVVAKVSAGKYLAKDTGVTVDLSRTFANGTAIGVWATKTNVSAEQFGEGSFDKGLYLNIPFDAMLPRSSPSMATVVWNPLTRDGGAKLARRFALFDLTRHADRAAWGFGPATASSTRDENNREPRSVFNALLPYRAGRPSLGTTFNLAPALTHNGLNTEALLWGTGAVGLAMAFDQPLADAIGNKGNTAQALNNIPYLLAAGVGAAAAGSLGEDARSTAYASLSAATWALGTNLLGKTLIGRARPDEGHGPWAFEGPHRASSQSSFASNHVTAAMALATPFAQRYNQPWLYGLASLTAVGRIQANEHWASDTVAGALLGYAFGSLALQNQHSHSKGLRFSASTERVVATLTY